jgi:hypothetical protein
MRIEMMQLSALLAMRHRKNPKAHDLDDLRGSFIRFGFTSPPMIDESTQVMVAGHGRCEALEMMRTKGEPPPTGIVEHGTSWMVPVIRDVSFKSERERDAYLVADNQLSIGPGWSDDALADMLGEFEESELDGLGFSADELADLLAPNEDNPGTDVDVNGHVRTIGASHKVRPPVQMTNDDWDLHLGDCLEGMRRLPDASVDSAVTDPPAGIGFMGRSWDGDKGGRGQWIAWLAERAAEMLRVLKPGGHGIVWSLPRTQHWTMTALEDAGFEIRDVVFHAFGSGFPKSLAIDKAIDAKLGATDQRPVTGVGTSGIANAFNESGETYATEFERTGPATAAAAAAALQGWGTALKPAVEPWIIVRKPVEGTVAENAMKHGTGGINVDATRIGDDVRHNPSASSMYSLGDKPMDDVGGTTAIGRWPSHFILSHTPACRPTGTAEDERTIGVGPRIGDASRNLEFGMGSARDDDDDDDDDLRLRQRLPGPRSRVAESWGFAILLLPKAVGVRNRGRAS